MSSPRSYTRHWKYKDKETIRKISELLLLLCFIVHMRILHTEFNLILLASLGHRKYSIICIHYCTHISELISSLPPINLTESIMDVCLTGYVLDSCPKELSYLKCHNIHFLIIVFILSL